MTFNTSNRRRKASSAHRSPVRQATRAGIAALRGQLPPRYEQYASTWLSGFRELASPGLHPGATILDVGAGRRPLFLPDQRPAHSSYLGLDIARSELEAAPPGSYDGFIVGDAAHRIPRLEDRFDLIVSWQVLEHVASLQRVMDNLYAYLRPGGYAVASLSGRYSVFAILNLLLPRRAGQTLVARAMRRDPQTVFPAYYDLCYGSALQSTVSQPWSEARIISAWNGAVYFGFMRPLQAAYVLYEEWARASGREDLATHYFLQLRK